MAKEISVRSTKQQILEAYQAALDKVKQQKGAEPKQEKKKADEEKILERIGTSTLDSILQNISALRLDLSKVLDNLGEQLVAEHKKLSDVRYAISIERQALQEMYDIKAETDSLAVLLSAQKERQAAFEAEIVQRQLQWKQEQEQHELFEKEHAAHLKKERDREREEYEYALKIARQRDQGAYDAKKVEVEKELAERRARATTEIELRETALAAREKEFAELNAKVEAFPTELEKAITQAEERTRDQIEARVNHQTEIREKDVQVERKLMQQTITALQEKIKETEQQMKALTQRANEAQQQINAIALKALESSTAVRVVTSAGEKAGDTGRS
ncbi:MAG: hypothetical protein HY966_03085 [Ignavibacteriales bacterium]|nr:hypothetical protein [Ignavibacteriales bacterium]